LTQVSEKPQELDFVDWLGRLAMELIGQAGIGSTFGAIQGENSDYSDALKGFLYAQLPTVTRS
jgi:hypothetical protein